MIPQYVVARIRQLLAEDSRTNLLDVQVRIVGKQLFLAGSVESAVRRQAAEDVAREALPDEMEVINELCIETYAP
jgi:osmotically-inducible protein OsmY